ncbi:MAG: hypothetical protein HKM03_10065, partial [Steroidobacteraceae bacterium]|nr:hypothetical protein [Steroidobacteraceae bacterium]
MRRPLKIALTITAGFVGVLVVAGLALFVAGNTVAGRRVLERAIRDLSAGRVELVGLQGNFPAHLTLARLTLSDRQGVWLSADRVVLDWRPLSLFERVVRVEDLRAARVVLTRLPAPAPGPHRPPASIPRIDVAHAQIEKLELGSQLAGHPAVLAVHGSVRLRSLEDLLARVDAVRLDAAGRYALRFAVDPLRVDARLSIQEPAGGPLENLLGLPDLGGIAATLLLQGPRTAERLDLRVQAGALRARAQGSVNLAARSAKIAYSVEAGAMSPRPGVGWQSVAASGQWRGGLDDEVADSKLDIRHLRLGKVATIAELQATLTGRAGLLGVQGEVSGLIPAGVPASVLAHDPISFEARYSPKDPSHQLHLRLEQPLFSLRGQIATRAPFAVVLNLDVPQIATFAALVKQSLRGHAAIRLELVRQAGREHFTLAASIAGFGGAAPWATAFGSSAKLQAQGSVGARHIDLPQLRISGRRWSVTGAGKALRRTSGSGALESLRAHWRLDAPDLSAFSPMLAGRLSGAGQIAGPPDALAGSGSLWVGGSFEAAPLRLALDWRRAGDGVVSAVIRRGTWKSVHLSGDFALDRAFAWTHGRFSAKIGDLADLDAITGGTLHGTLQADATVGRLAGRLDLNLHAVTHDAAIDRLAADVEAWASGPPDALKVRLAARMPQLGGAAASAASTGMLNLARRQLHIATFTLDYRDRVARLLAPADLTYGGGISTAAARLSIGGATLAFAGRIAPNLKLSASLEGAAAPLVDLFAPGLLAHGRIAAKASFQGRLAAPTGELRWSASGMRSAAAEALGLPAVDFDGKA